MARRPHIGHNGGPPLSDRTIELPVLHAGQIAAYMAPYRFKVVRCGRRWGKTLLGITVICDLAAKGYPVGFFAPNYKILTETYHDILNTLRPMKASASRIDGVIRTVTGGRVDFWSLDNPNAGRSRKYKLVVIDEAAFTKPGSIAIWERAIRATLVDMQGSALVLSNTNGVDPDNMLWQLCNEEKFRFHDYHAPTSTNPYMPPAELELLREENHPLVFAQEYEAEFVDFSGVQFFDREKLTGKDGLGVPYPTMCDSVFAVIDTAVKDGKEHDGTGVSYWARSQFVGHPLVCLDWDLVQIEGALLETWLPTVYQRLEALAKECKARKGSIGAFIEDKYSGSILIQQAKRRNWPATAIPAEMTALGKDGRALAVSGYVHQGHVKFTQPAYDKVLTFKKSTRNHMLSQVLNFRMSDPKAHTRADDLLDTFCYAIQLALGNHKGQ